MRHGGGVNVAVSTAYRSLTRTRAETLAGFGDETQEVGPMGISTACHVLYNQCLSLRSPAEEGLERSVQRGHALLPGVSGVWTLLLDCCQCKEERE